MKKSDFIREVAKRSEMTIKDTTEVLKIVGDAIVEYMKDEDGVTPFSGIKFATNYRDAYTARNPQNGEPISVAAHYQPKVKFGRAVKDALN